MSNIKHMAVIFIFVFCSFGQTAYTQQPPSFDTDIHPVPPDYAQASNWAALPARADAADGAPPNDGLPDSQASANVDVFYIHPTTYQGKDHWNQSLDDEATNDWTDISVIARQASAFNACCKVYAPRYRQAGTGALADEQGSGGKAYALAYQDVYDAFRYYLKVYNHGRPFILAGHSQGTLEMYRLIAEVIDGKPLEKQFVAAYAVGVGVSVGDFGHTYHSVKPCMKPADIDCIVSWNSFVVSGDPAAYRARSEMRFASRYGQTGKTLLCINPLTFDADRPKASASSNLGALPGSPGHGELPELIPGQAAAACVDGVLMVDPPKDPAFKLRLLPKGSFHYHDIDTFYENIRINTILRIAAYFQAHSQIAPLSPAVKR